MSAPPERYTAEQMEEAMDLARAEFYKVRGGDDREMGFWQMGFEDGYKHVQSSQFESATDATRLQSLEAENARLREALRNVATAGHDPTEDIDWIRGIARNALKED